MQCLILLRVFGILILAVSNIHARNSISLILKNLPLLIQDLKNINYREEIMRASMFAGLAFSNTKTAISHSISYQ